MIKATLHSDPKFLTTIQVNDHIQILDEPVSVGGNNQGPTPIQTIYSALAGCITMTLRMYADHKKISLDRVDVKIDAEVKDVSEDDERFRDQPWMIDKGKVRFIHATVEVKGNLDSGQIKKLDNIAGKCPVHKILKHGAYITHETSHIS